MASDLVRREIEELSGVVVLAEPGDSRALEEIESRLEAIALRAAEEGDERLEAIARRTRELIARSREGDRMPGEKLAEELNCAVSSLQGALLDEGQDVAQFRGDPELCTEFIAEAREHLESMERHLLVLDRSPGDDEALNAVFRGFHTIKGVAAHLKLEEITTLAHEAENLLDRVRHGEQPWNEKTVETVLEAVDVMRSLVNGLERALTTGEHLVRDISLPRLLACMRDLASGDVEAAPDEETVVAAEVTATKSPEEDGDAREQPAPRGKSRARDYVRIDAGRLDLLVETIGELVTSVSVLGQLPDVKFSQPGQEALKELGKISAELQELGTSLRMVPLRSTFQKMTRCVRDVAREVGKKVDMQIAGEETELDKSMVERLSDPLLHLVRNAVDHGVETNAEERLLLGKRERGLIELRAYHRGGSIYIEVQDDGKGLDRGSILEKARERGLIPDGEVPDDPELYKMIFEPGFSTAGSVTSVSGRGVGLDVVKRNIEDLQGSIEVETRPGLGTRFTIRVPLTIAIIDGMVVRVGEERFIVPTLSIVRSVKPSRDDLATILEREEVMKEKETLVPLYRLGELFGIENAVGDPTEGLIVVVENEGRQVGLLTDELLGQQHVVIKSLGGSLGSVPGIAGGAIMADGRVGLIVDLAGLFRIGRGDRKRQRFFRCAARSA